MHRLSPQVGRQSCAQFAPTDQVPKCLQAKQLTPINSSRIRKNKQISPPKQLSQSVYAYIWHYPDENHYGYMRLFILY